MSSVYLSELLRLGGVDIQGELDPATQFRRISYHSQRDVTGSLFIAFKANGSTDTNSSPTQRSMVPSPRSSPAAGPKPSRRSPSPSSSLTTRSRLLQELSRARRAELPNMVVVGVTGSVGKTSTKEIIASVLSRQFRTFRNPGNLNSEIGLPLAMLEVPRDTEVGVFEMAGAWVMGECDSRAGGNRRTLSGTARYRRRRRPCRRSP